MDEKFARSCQNGHTDVPGAGGGIGQLLQLRAKNGAGDVVRHVTGTGSGLLGEIPRVVVQISALT